MNIHKPNVGFLSNGNPVCSAYVRQVESPDDVVGVGPFGDVDHMNVAVDDWTVTVVRPVLFALYLQRG